MTKKTENELETGLKKKLSAKTDLKPSLKNEAKLKEQKTNDALEKVKVAISLVVLAAGFVLFYQLPASVPALLKAACPIISTILFAVLILFWCDSGKRLIQYIKGSVVEIKKVVWPEKNEALRQTLFVIAFVAILAGFTWVCDLSLQLIIYKMILGVGN